MGGLLVGAVILFWKMTELAKTDLTQIKSKIGEK
jgi:hypothetical protein